MCAGLCLRNRAAAYDAHGLSVASSQWALIGWVLELRRVRFYVVLVVIRRGYAQLTAPRQKTSDIKTDASDFHGGQITDRTLPAA